MLSFFQNLWVACQCKTGDMLLAAARKPLGCNWMSQVWRHMVSFLFFSRNTAEAKCNLICKAKNLLRQKMEFVSFAKEREGNVMLHICKENHFSPIGFKGSRPMLPNFDAHNNYKLDLAERKQLFKIPFSSVCGNKFSGPFSL